MKKINLSLTSFLIIVIGISAFFFFLGNISNKVPLKFDSTVNLFDAISLIITIMIAFYLGRIIDKRNTNERIEKDIVINNIKLILDDIKELTKSINNKSLEYSEAAHYTKKIRSNLLYIKKITDMLNYEMNNNYSNIQNEISELRNLLTDTPILNSDKPILEDHNMDIMVKNNILHYNNQHRLRIIDKIEKLELCIYEIIFSINKF